VWLAPVQVVVMPITDRQLDYAKKVHARLEEAGCARTSTIARKSESQDSRIAIAKGALHAGGGRRESEAGTVSVRHRKHAIWA